VLGAAALARLRIVAFPSLALRGENLLAGG
jgi:hypothetical protein